MRPRRHLPPWRRLALEYIAIVLVFVLVFRLTSNTILAIVAMIGTMFLLRATRPKYYQDGPPGPDDRP